MDPDELVSSILLTLALIAAVAFFVAAEFAILTLRRRRVEQIARDGAGSSAAFAAAEQAEEISLVAQLGSVVCTLVLGWLVASMAVSTLAPVPEALSLGIAFTVVAVLYLVLAQQLPRLLGAQRAGWVANPVVILPLRATALVLRPLIALLSYVLEAISEALRLSRSAFYAPVHTLEDIRELVTQGHQQGVVEEDEREMIHGVFDFSETVAREVMTPRIDIVAVPTDVQLAELIHLVVSEGHSRLPVFSSTIDNIVGVLLAKDLLPLLTQPHWSNGDAFDVTALMREPYFVPDTKPVDDILAEFRQSSVHLAIVIDEFGGTYGLVTMEDLLEEIVGEIHDEYDVAEPEFSPTPEGDILIDGGAAISEVNERFGLALPEEDFDTIGGYVFGALGRVPVQGDQIDTVGENGSASLQVEETEDRRVVLVRLRFADSAVAPEPS
jgi:putative hemolysin